jgi:mannose-6-phosphate isomerase-like protein (cupin superfamily)
VIEDAKAHGLVLAETGKLYDTKQGQNLPDGVAPMPLLTEAELAHYPEPTTAEVVPNHVARYWDMFALADRGPARVIGEQAMLRDRPGFDVDFLTVGSVSNELYSVDRHEVLMPVRGHWRLIWEGGTTTLNPGDTCAVPPGVAHAIEPAMTGEASLFRVRDTDDPAGATMTLGV